jgi:hypothetical protein
MYLILLNILVLCLSWNSRDFPFVNTMSLPGVGQGNDCTAVTVFAPSPLVGEGWGEGS